MKKALLVLSLIVVFTVNLHSGITIHVKYDATGSNNGTSWTDAYTSFQSALAAAVSGDQIWVAKGTYKPSYDYELGGGSRFYHFRMIEGVAIYGGFAGSETAVSERTNFGAGQANETILSGDLNGNDDKDKGDSYHVFYHPGGLGLTSSAVLDGFTIKGGNANGSYTHNRGGGMANYTSSSPTINNCTFTSNLAYLNGGGMYNEYSSPTLTNCTFTSNPAYDGGGMWNESSSPTLTNCTFTSNVVPDIGGGMYNNYHSSPTLTNCTFTSNSAAYNGAGGGMYNFDSSSPTLTNCTFTSNFALSAGGGMFNENSSPNLTNCTFTSNSVSVAGPGNGGGMCNFSSSPTLTNCTFTSDTAVNGGGMLNYDASSPTLNNCTFTSNFAFSSGGGMWNEFSSPTLNNCTFSSNSVPGSGGGMVNGGTVSGGGSSPILTNCTFTSNSAGDGGGMANYISSSPTLNNCIIWGNEASTNGDEFWINYATITLNYSCYANASGDIYISGGTFADTNHNITSDPQFVGSSINPAHPYSILGTSPCADAGNDSYNSQAYDIRGVGYPRKLNNTTGGVGTIDMGAYEYKIGDDPLTSVETGIASTPKKFTLSQNYPNPFNPSTKISFNLLSKSFVSLKVYDLIGREVSTIVSEELSAGNHSCQWNAANVPSGIYFYRLQAGSFSETKKLVLLR